LAGLLRTNLATETTPQKAQTQKKTLAEYALPDNLFLKQAQVLLPACPAIFGPHQHLDHSVAGIAATFTSS
jgi:hypothetical protein